MFDGFLGGFFAKKEKTDKDKMQERIKDSAVNLILDRDQSYLKTARKGNTSILVQTRGGGVEEFYYQGRKYVSIPSEMEREFEGLTPWEAEDKMDDILRVLTHSDVDIAGCEESGVSDAFKEKVISYTESTGQVTSFLKGDDIASKNFYQYRVSKSEDESKDEGEDESMEEETKDAMTPTMKGMDDSSSGVQQEVKLEMVGDEDSREYSFQNLDMSVDSTLPKEIKSNSFFGREVVKEKDEHHLKALAKQIIKSFKGRVSKQNTITPSKRIRSKRLANDVTDKIYTNKHGDNGKHLNVNLILDMSGSMSGTPVKNAIKMVYVFNEIALAGHLKGCVIWSESSSRCKAEFPMPREMIRKMARTGGGEGLAENMDYYFEDLKKADINICMTDGDICDSPIVKDKYIKHKVDTLGVYVNKDAKDLTEYTGSLDRWFMRSLVRHTFEELCEKIIQIGLRKKG